MEILNVKDWMKINDQSLKKYFDDIVNAITVQMILHPLIDNWIIIVHKHMEKIVRNRFLDFYVIGSDFIGPDIYYFIIVNYDSVYMSN